jgi:hypothetical protein
MNLSIKQSYFAMFYLLDSFYKGTTDECFISLLSGFDPHLFVDSMSADPAAWCDWNNVVKKIIGKDLLTSEEVLHTTKGFVQFHIDEFGFELGWLIEELNKITVSSQRWIGCVKKALAE